MPIIKIKINKMRKQNRKERSRDKSNQKKHQKKRENETFMKIQNFHCNKGMQIIIESDSSILNKYDNLNKKYVESLIKDEKNKIEQISYNNFLQTPAESAKKYGDQLFSILVSLTKDSYTNKSTIFQSPKLPFGQILTDENFLTLVSECAEYCKFTKSSDELTKITDKFINEEDNIKQLFYRPCIIKNLVENSIITILVNPYKEDEIENNISLLSIKDSSYIPLVNIPFIYNKRNYDLNKDSLLADLLSPILIGLFKENLNIFINNFNLSEEQLKNKITDYINNHNIYFIPLKNDLQGISIHTGDIFINLKYIREYFDPSNKDKSIIIREKIILIIFHEMNHGLIRTIDTSLNNNFLINSKVKGKNKKKYLKFNSVNKNESFRLPIKESGNYFDYLLSNGIYIDKIDLDVAELFLNIAKFENRENFINYLKELLKKMKVQNENIFKFKMNYFSNISQCAFSINRRYQIKEKEENVSDSDSDSDSD